MAHVTLSRSPECRRGWLATLLGSLRISRFGRGHAPARLNAEEWPDYLLKDVGLPVEHHRGPRDVPIEWIR